ncbi:MAG: DNA-deoxyinosine glycosylase [Mariprofundus sp.]|nr:DNA-deoxyinosine glycosylase [Mariprofundus sp.]
MNACDTGFPCSANPNARILILGSMPSVKSLIAAQYYAHPQNAFWPIIEELFSFNSGLEYEQRLACLRTNHVALWDVAQQCIRPGSMDHAIDMESVTPNDFSVFFDTHPHVRAIFFNGRKAEELFRKRVLSLLSDKHRQIERHLLPSSSPAHAGISRAQKLEAWKIIVQTLENS